jgi:hypothetical protein
MDLELTYVFKGLGAVGVDADTEDDPDLPSAPPVDEVSPVANLVASDLRAILVGGVGAFW